MQCTLHNVAIFASRNKQQAYFRFALGAKRRVMISSSIYCTNCGTANVQQAKFCFGCGHALQSGSLAAPGSLTGWLTHN